MKSKEIYELIQSKFPDAAVEMHEGSLPGPAKDEPGHAGDSFIVVPAANIVAIGKMLKTIDSFSFDCLSDLTAVDRKENYEVVYHLFSYRHNHSVVLKVILPHDDAPHVVSVEGVWPVANWLEREVYDLFGIVFDGHSDLRRIMLPDDWVGHPLRKDYKEEEDYHGIGTTRTPLLQ